jgi:peroxidase
LISNINIKIEILWIQLGGPSWNVKLGRKDSTTASRADADANIPGPSFSLSQLIKNFDNHGLNEQDLVALSGAHTIGFSRCLLFRDRIYNDNNINTYFAKQLQNICPREGGDSNLAPLDSVTSAKFDVAYYADLIKKKGVLHSDQELLKGGSTSALVKKYRYDTEAFYYDFVKSMIKMGNIKPLVGSQGEVRCNCRKAN